MMPLEEQAGTAASYERLGCGATVIVPLGRDRPVGVLNPIAGSSLQAGIGLASPQSGRFLVA
jgi:hypothetical protein